MLKCQYCHKELPNDSEFCIYCGKSININSKESEIEVPLKENKRQNFYSKLGIFLFLFALIILDFILGSLIQTLGGNYRIVFYVSLMIYILSISLGILSLYIDYRDKKNGFIPTGNTKFALLSIVMSLYIALLNVTQVIIK